MFSDFPLTLALHISLCRGKGSSLFPKKTLPPKFVSQYVVFSQCGQIPFVWTFENETRNVPQQYTHKLLLCVQPADQPEQTGLVGRRGLNET